MPFENLTNKKLKEGLNRIKVRSKEDLPEEIRGTAVWMQPSADKNGTVPPSSFHALAENLFYPVEFINFTWYWLEWDDSLKWNGYWARPEKQISHRDYGLGWVGNTIDAPTPKAIAGPSFSTTRERAESASTQPQDDAVDDPADDDFIDSNPAQTELLATEFGDHPVFADIAEEIEPSQARSHYLPTTLPSGTSLRPIRINPRHAMSNPIWVRSTLPGGPGLPAAAPTVDATQQITNAIKTDGS
jgi:hypothetical protein